MSEASSLLHMASGLRRTGGDRGWRKRLSPCLSYMPLLEAAPSKTTFRRLLLCNVFVSHAWSALDWETCVLQISKIGVKHPLQESGSRKRCQFSLVVRMNHQFYRGKVMSSVFFATRNDTKRKQTGEGGGGGGGTAADNDREVRSAYKAFLRQL